MSTAETFLYDCRTIVSIRKVGNFAAIDSLLYKADIEGRSRAGHKGFLRRHEPAKPDPPARDDRMSSCEGEKLRRRCLLSVKSRGYNSRCLF